MTVSGTPSAAAHLTDARSFGRNISHQRSARSRSAVRGDAWSPSGMEHLDATRGMLRSITFEV
jgi:hypothetical protein